MVDTEALLHDTIGNGDATMPKSARPQLAIRPSLAPNAPPAISGNPSPSEGRAAKLLELLEAEKLLPNVIETAAYDCARKNGCLPQYERRKAAIYDLIGDPD